ncbi:hypothetical protein HY638_01720 [Candidatus Woesearchaeota archaeon]|nr:hypothetical protein [Candidatus Woesearchaeota archaeon]
MESYESRFGKMPVEEAVALIIRAISSLQYYNLARSRLLQVEVRRRVGGEDFVSDPRTTEYAIKANDEKRDIWMLVSNTDFERQVEPEKLIQYGITSVVGRYGHKYAVLEHIRDEVMSCPILIYDQERLESYLISRRITGVEKNVIVNWKKAFDGMMERQKPPEKRVRIQLG